MGQSVAHEKKKKLLEEHNLKIASSYFQKSKIFH